MKEQTEKWTLWILRLLVPAILGVIWSDQRAASKNIQELTTSIAVINASRFTAADWVKAAAEVSERMNAMATQNNSNDKRITRLEDAMSTIRDGMNRIESKVSK